MIAFGGQTKRDFQCGKVTFAARLVNLIARI